MNDLQEVLPLSWTSILHGGLHPQVCNPPGDAPVKGFEPMQQQPLQRAQAAGFGCRPPLPASATEGKHHPTASLPARMPGSRFPSHRTALPLPTGALPPAALFPSLRSAGKWGIPPREEGDDEDRKAPPWLALHSGAHSPTGACAGKDISFAHGFPLQPLWKRTASSCFPKYKPVANSAGNLPHPPYGVSPKTAEQTLKTPEVHTWNQPNAIYLPLIVKDEMTHSVIILPSPGTCSLLTGLSNCCPLPQTPDCTSILNAQMTTACPCDLLCCSS